jgi:hypothetical protein
MSTVADIAQAVADQLNGAGLSQTFTAEVRYRPLFDIKDFKTLKVTVVPRGVPEIVPASRTKTSRTVEIDIGVMKKVTGEEDFGPLLDLVEEITLCFRVGQRLIVVQSAPIFPQKFPTGPAGVPVCTAIRNEPVYAPEHFERYRQFTSVVTLTYEVIG